MRRSFFLLTLLLLSLICVTSCAERFDTPETEETETEEEYVRPPKDYLTQLAENLGYADYPDSVWCYQSALVSEEDFVTLDKIEFDMNTPSPEYFISWHYTYTLEIKNESADGMLVTEYPNSCYLTSNDGERRKLCPYEDCRNDYSELCSHINLQYGQVAGDWVYFVGVNECVASPKHPNRSIKNGAVNMLLRYSISENRVEKLLDLPSNVIQLFSAYDVLYVNLTDPRSNAPYMLLIDSNDNVCKTDTLPHVGTIPSNGKLYGAYNGEVFCHTPALDEYTTISTTAASIIGEHNGYIYLKHSDNGGKYVGATQEQSEYKESVSLLSPDGTETMLFENIYDAAVTGGSLYIVTRTPPFHVFDIEKINAQVFTNNDGKVLRYSLKKNGTLDGEPEIVFDTSLHTTESGEYLYGIDDFGNSIRVTTYFAPPLEHDNRCGMRMYILTDDGSREDGEGMMSRN